MCVALLLSFAALGSCFIQNHLLQAKLVSHQTPGAQSFCAASRNFLCHFRIKTENAWKIKPRGVLGCFGHFDGASGNREEEASVELGATALSSAQVLC